jgi:hypothetical protein
MQIFSQNLQMTYLATYPKFSSIALLNFELQQNVAKMKLNFNSKYTSKNMVMLCKSCRPSITETNKIGFAFF